MKIPASRRKRIRASIGTKDCYIDLVPGPLAYLWIGNDKQLAGVVKDSEVERLRDACVEILDRRNLEKRTA